MYDIVVFDNYEFLDSLPLVPEQHGTGAGNAFDWLDDLNFASNLLARTRQQYMVDNPESVRYNVAWLPEPPKHYKALVDPVTTRIVLEETKLNKAAEEAPNIDYGKRHWLKSFQGSVQFSQAYISPNWYQGGNNNVNMIASGIYNVKLNEKYHPNLLFETTVSYKLGLNNAPNDTVNDYNISEDLFQVNSKFGLKAFKNWYYSVAATFKTQLLNNYPVNSRDMKAAFMAPGELNIGLGMSYSTKNAAKGTEFGASISPSHTTSGPVSTRASTRRPMESSRDARQSVITVRAENAISVGNSLTISPITPASLSLPITAMSRQTGSIRSILISTASSLPNCMSTSAMTVRPRNWRIRSGISSR